MALEFNKCCFCIELRTGCLIIGYLNLIGNIVMILLSILGLAAAGVVTAQGKDEDVQAVGAVMFAVVAIMLVFLILFLAFTIVLLVGLHQLVSLFMLSGSIACLIIKDEETRQLSTPQVQYMQTFGLHLSMTSVRILMVIAIVVALFGMMFSVMLVVGILKNKPSFVLCYFAFGIIITIVCQLCALLVLLENCWILALSLFIVSLFHIHFLVVVHTVYELMLRGKDFRFHQQAEDVDPLADCFDEDTERL